MKLLSCFALLATALALASTTVQAARYKISFDTGAAPATHLQVRSSSHSGERGMIGGKETERREWGAEMRRDTASISDAARSRSFACCLCLCLSAAARISARTPCPP